MVRVNQIINKNLPLLLYLVFLIVVPLFFSGYVTLQLKNYWWFFKELHPIDLTIIFLGFSFTMAFSLTPTTFICLISGFLWGWQSLIYLIPSYLLAQSMGYGVGKLFNGEKLIETLKEIKKFPAFLDGVIDNQATIVFLARLSPAIPFGIMNLVLSLFRIKFSTFTWAGILGMIPRSIFFIWTGTRIEDLRAGIEGQNSTINIISTLVTIVCVYLLFRITTKKVFAKARKTNSKF